MESGIDIVPETVRMWCKEFGVMQRCRYIKPKVTIRHKIDRLILVLDQMNFRTEKLTNLENIVHWNEYCFFMMMDGTVCSFFPYKKGEY